MAALSQDALMALAQAQSAKSGVPAALLYAMILRESKGDPAAVGDQGRALGLMQVHAPAAKEMGFKHKEMMDPEKALQAGGGYIAKMLQRFQDPKLALSAYNAGPGATRAAGGVVPSAQDYIDEVSGTITDMTQPGQPYADELAPEFRAPDALQRQQTTKTLQGLVQAGPYSPMGIKQLLSAFKFNQ